MPKKISIIITCYNLGEFLPDALESLEGLTAPGGIETIIVDDGSTDPATVAVLDALDADRYRIIRQANTGLSKARNNGIRASEGDYIIPLDADNRLRPAIIDRTIAVLDAEPEVDVVYGDLEFIGARTGRHTVGPYSFSRLYRKNYIDACASFRRSLWDRVGGYDEQMLLGYEDWDLWLRAAVSGSAFRYVPEVLFEYRVRPGSMLSNTNKRRDEIVEYMFSKRALGFLREIREEHIRLVEAEANRPHLTGRDHLKVALGLLKQRLKRRFTKED